MKNSNKRKQKAIKDLAEQFSHELDAQLPVAVLPNGDLAYKNYIVRQNKLGNWNIHSIKSKDIVDQFYLKTCALMAAKAYNNVKLDTYSQIKELDNKYWASHSDSQVYKKNIKTAKEFGRFLILLNKLEDSEQKAEHYKEEISRMFKWSFV
jgi:hypothetical protein